jgi:hypothetical protein
MGFKSNAGRAAFYERCGEEEREVCRPHTERFEIDVNYHIWICKRVLWKRVLWQRVL